MKKTTYTIYKVSCEAYWRSLTCLESGPDGITEKDAMFRADSVGWRVICGCWACPAHVDAFNERSYSNDPKKKKKSGHKQVDATDEQNSLAETPNIYELLEYLCEEFSIPGSPTFAEVVAHLKSMVGK